MKKNIKIVVSVVVVLAIIVSIAAAFKLKDNTASKKTASSVAKSDKPKSADDEKLKNNKNVKDIKKTENGDGITLTINGKDTASVAELKALALDTANELKKSNADKKVNVIANYKDEQVENINFGNKSNENQIYFETQPMYDPVLQCVRFKMHNAANIDKIQMYLDDKEIQISDKQILKTKNDIVAIKNVSQDFKAGKIILQDKNGNKINSNF